MLGSGGRKQNAKGLRTFHVPILKMNTHTWRAVHWVWGLQQACQRLGYQLVLSTRRAQRVDVQHVMDLEAALRRRAWEALSVCPPNVAGHNIQCRQ